MNILILNWRDPKNPLAGGAEIALLEHAKYWKQQGADITWFSSKFSGAKELETHSGIQYIRKGSHYSVHLKAFFYLFRFKNKKFDVVIDNFHFLPFFTPLYIKKTKIVAFIHEVAGKVWYKNLFWPFAFIGYHLEPFFFKLYQSVYFITVSDSTKLELIKMGIKTRNIFVIHNGVTRAITKEEKAEEPTILFLGRISQDKGIEDALRIFTKILASNPDMRFWIAGKEEHQGLFQSLKVKYPGLNGVVKYWGYVTEKEKFKLLKQAWVLLHPSAKEGWGLTVIEAATQGTPTVAYDVEGLRDSIKNKKTGLLTKQSFDALADAVIEVMSNEKKLMKLSSNAFDYSRQFDWCKSGAASWELINSL